MPRVWSRMVLYHLREITFRLQIYVHKSSIKDNHNVNINFEQYFLLKDNLLKTSRKDLYPDIAVFAYICSEVRKYQFFSLLAISIGRQRKMASTACSIFCFPRKTYREAHFTHSFVVHSSLEMIPPRMKTAQKTGEIYLEGDEAADKVSGLLNRRSLLASGAFLVSSVTALGLPRQSFGIVKQGPLAGRVPGLSEPNEQGWRTYRRPDEKSGGHGVGWSPIIPYAFSVPEGWEEVPVSIADLGGTEIDLRFGNSKQGKLSVIVAPVLRFADNLGDDATIEKIGPPEKVISAFGPEVIGENVEGKVVSMGVAKHLGRIYYQFELEPPHVLITATAAGNRLYLFNVTGSGLQWKRHYPDLKRIADSFRVV